MENWRLNTFSEHFHSKRRSVTTSSMQMIERTEWGLVQAYTVSKDFVFAVHTDTVGLRFETSSLCTAILKRKMSVLDCISVMKVSIPTKMYKCARALNPASNSSEWCFHRRENCLIMNMICANTRTIRLGQSRLSPLAGWPWSTRNKWL